MSSNAASAALAAQQQSQQAAVANAAVSASNGQQQQQQQGSFMPANTLPSFSNMAGGMAQTLGIFPFGAQHAQQFLQHQREQAAQQAAAAAQIANTPGKGNKKAKGPTGTPIPGSITPGQLAHFQQQMAAGLPASAYPGFMNYTGIGQVPGGAVIDGAPRGRWTEEMTFRLIDLRSKMDGRFRTVARPDKLWLEITQAICGEFNAMLPKQSTKDKWKNLRSSYRLINQGKHPSHYTKETWPFYERLERYVEQRTEFDRNPEGAIPSLGGHMMDTGSHSDLHLGKMDRSGGDSSAGENESAGEEDEAGGQGEEDEEDDDAGEDGDQKGKTDKKRKRSSSGRQSSSFPSGQSVGASSELGNALKPRDVTRKERDWAATVRALNAHMVASIQDSHQTLMQHLRSYSEIADKIAPSSAVRRHRADVAAQHAIRMQEVSMEVEVVRAEPKHLSLLVQLFDQYRVFYQQQSDPERASQFLAERLAKNQSAIFIALPVLNAQGEAVGSQLPAAPAPAPAAAGHSDATLSLEESHHATSLTSTMSVAAGQSSSTIGTAQRSSRRLPSFAYGFAQLYPSFSSVRLGRHWIVNDLFVHPSVRNRGIGSLLLTHVKKFATDTGATSMELETQVNNITAQKLYTRLEWRKETESVIYTQKL